MGTKLLKTELNELIQKMPEDRRPIGKKIAEELVYMDTTMKNLKQAIEEIGPVEHFQNGSQSFLRENPALKSYSVLINRYANLLKQFEALLPKDTTVSSAVLDFIQ